MQRPDLTLPEAEAEALARAYAGATTILEYGSGGSTALAAELPGRTVFSVESDRKWARMMEGWFAANPPAATVHMHPVFVGKTLKWGHPADESAIRRWPLYALSVWDRPDFQHPDVILIDGRFRPACLVAASFRISRPVTVLFDDYTPRPAYHRVESLVQPVEIIGRMARFEIEPTPLPPERMVWFVSLLMNPA